MEDEKENLFVIGRLLYKFLVSKGAYRQYLFNSLKNDDYGELVLTNKMKILSWLKRKYITGAFVWSKTPEGPDYWDKLNTEWRYFLQHEKEKYKEWL